MSTDEVERLFAEVIELRETIKTMERKGDKQFLVLHANQKRLLSIIDEQYHALMQTMTDEGRDGPRLFSLQATRIGFFDKAQMTSAKFRLTLWCEHARRPLPELNGQNDSRGVYELELKHEWLQKIAPYLKRLSTVLKLVLPVSMSATELAMDDDSFKQISEELDFGKACADSFLDGGERYLDAYSEGDSADSKTSDVIRATGSALRELHGTLKKKDPDSQFGGLVRVQNKQRKNFWVHEIFADDSDYFRA